MAGTGNQATLSFGTTTGFTPAVDTIELPEFVREALEDDDLSTDGQLTFYPNDLYDPGETAVTYYYDQSPTTQPPIDQPAEDITITFPLKAGEVTPATFAGSGFLISDNGPTLENGETMMGGFTIKWDGKTEAAYTPGSMS